MKAFTALRQKDRSLTDFGPSPFGWNPYANQFSLPIATYGQRQAEAIVGDFPGFARVLQQNAVISAIELLRFSVFSEVRFQFQQIRSGRPGDLFGNQDLGILEEPFPGGTTGDLLTRMLLDADIAGNAYQTIIDGEMVRLRPDWVEIVVAPRQGNGGQVGYKRVGYLYWEGGKITGGTPAVFLPNEVAHFAPYPDPLATYRGMSWMSPLIREIQADAEATLHKLMYFTNGAQVGLSVSLDKDAKASSSPEAFEAFVTKMDAAHKGTTNAYKTLYTAGGADVRVIGANMQQADFTATQGAGEVRIAAAAGVHPVILGFSDGLKGSALNEGNYAAAKNRFADGTMRPLWRNVCGSLSTIVQPPPNSRLWTDDRDVAFLRYDQKDLAEIQAQEAQSIRTLRDGGFEAASVTAAISANDWSLLVPMTDEEGRELLSVQLQPPGLNDTPDVPTPPLEAA